MLWLMLFVKVLSTAAFFLPHSYSQLANAVARGSETSENSCRVNAAENHNGDKASRIMFNQQSRKREAMRYHIIAAEACEPLARRMEEVRLIRSILIER